MNETYGDLLLLMKLFGEGKITQYAIEQKLLSYLGSDSSVKIIKDIDNTTTTSFVMAALPKYDVRGLHMNYLIDLADFKVYFTNEEILGMIQALAKNKQTLYKMAFDFTSSHTDMDVDRSMALELVLKFYLVCLDAMKSVIKDPNKVKIFPRAELLNSAIEVLSKNTDKYENVREKLLVSDCVCQEEIDIAESLIHIANDASEAKITFVDSNHTDDQPSMNGLHQYLKDITNGTSSRDPYSTKIDINYKPSTNQ
jgi:hypothetical protein